jgi:hypothetical protein
MAIKVVTKDCTQLSDAELAEMADICADGPSLYEVGQLSKQVEQLFEQQKCTSKHLKNR